MINSKRPLTIRADEIILDKMKMVAAKNRRSLNAQIEQALEACIEAYEREHGVILLEGQREE